jgi:glycosyltransferase involved in cell wall biosynthesis
MKITVILCTYNRCRSLANALGSLAASEVPESVTWEVLVVDNNSKDRTREVTEEFCRRYPDRFRYLFEPRQGKSYALNAAILEARGHILAFTDDDVLVAPTWLQNVTAPLDSGEWAGVGGRILIARELVCPNWLTFEGEYNQGGVLALFDLDGSAREISKPPYGANMSFRKEMFQKHGTFRTDLGRCAESLLSNEDTEFGRRLVESGEHLWYEPSAVVYHAVAENRLKKSYFLKFWYDYGRSQSREYSNRSDVWRIPRWCFSAPLMLFNVLPARVRIWMFSRDPKRRFFFKCVVWRTWGEIVELPRIWMDEKRRKRKSPGDDSKRSAVTFDELGSTIKKDTAGVP